MPVSYFLLAAFLASPSPSPAGYYSAITLPMEVYTADGSAIPKGKSGLEIRSENGESVLAFLSGSKTIAVVKGTPYAGAAGFTVPVLGTILLRPAEASKTEKSEAMLQISPYLTNTSWKATLRLYRAANPASNELHAVFRQGARRVEFKLFSVRPAARRGTP